MTETRPALVVSACLLGVACNHRGAGSPRSAVQSLAGTYRLVPVCPEVAGGLPTPRPAAEVAPAGEDAAGRSTSAVLTAAGDDVTDLYRRGAEHTVALARATSAVGAVLKARSPSCGCHEIFDGTHSGTLVPGRGVTAAALTEAGFPVCSEEDVTGHLPWDAPGA